MSHQPRTLAGVDMGDLDTARTSIHIGAVTVLLRVCVKQELIDSLREANALIGALLLAEEGNLNTSHFDPRLPTIAWPAGVELPGGAE